MKRRRVWGAALAINLTLLICTGPGAFARSGGGDPEVIVYGTCSKGSHYKLKAKFDDGRIEVEGEVDSNVNGQTWKWKIRHNGDLSAWGEAVTQPPSGSFDVERQMADLAGVDSFIFRARNKGNKELCRGTVSL